MCESHCDKNFKKSRFHWLSRQFLLTELCRDPICKATEELHPDAPDLQPGLETQGNLYGKNDTGGTLEGSNFCLEARRLTGMNL